MAVFPASALGAPSVTASNTKPVPAEVVTFKATQDGVSRWDWDFDYRGGNPRYELTGKSDPVTFAFADYGEYFVVAHGRERNNDVFGFVRVRVDKVTASVSMAPAEPRTGENVTFTAAAELAPNRAVSSYEWDFDGDGFDDGTTPTVTRTYADAGTYSARVRVVNDWDTAGESAPVTFTVAAPPPAAGTGGPAGSGQSSGTGGGDGQAVLGSRTGAGSQPAGLTATALRLMDPRPFIRIRGRTTGRGARIDLFSVRAPGGATILVRCNGKGCPVKTASGRVKGKKVRTVRFKAIERVLRAGIVLEVRVTKEGSLGRYTRFRIGRLNAPVRWDACLVPGSNSPRAC